MNILISTILRNESKYIDTWYKQLCEIVATQPDHSFSLSVFENDSTDDTVTKLRGYDFSLFKSFQITTAKLNSPYFIGGSDPSRVNNLAYCRNHTIYSFPFLHEMDRVIVIEPDVEYTMDVADKIINHAKYYGKEYDVFSGKSCHFGRNAIYDSWATRKTKDQPWWLDSDGENGPVQEMWTIYHCLCSYSAKAIREGCRFSGINPRTGRSDCDTVNIVESFRLKGYDKVAWHPDLHVFHHTES